MGDHEQAVSHSVRHAKPCTPHCTPRWASTGRHDRDMGMDNSQRNRHHQAAPAESAYTVAGAEHVQAAAGSVAAAGSAAAAEERMTVLTCGVALKDAYCWKVRPSRIDSLRLLRGGGTRNRISICMGQHHVYSPVAAQPACAIPLRG